MQDGRPDEGGTGSAVRWREWGRASFEEAAAADRPIFLFLTTPWSRWGRSLEADLLADDQVRRLLEADLLPMRVDADRMPHVRDRYMAAGIPTLAFLTPAGDVLWGGSELTAGRFLEVARGALNAWHQRRDELETEIRRREMALEATRTRHRGGHLVRRETADDVLAAMQEAFDARNGGFGDAPKFGYPEAVELLFIAGHRFGNPDWTGMAERTLDAILAGELLDPVDGGFFRYARAADWTSPQPEKLLVDNAGLLRAFALGARCHGREEWAAAAASAVRWADERLRLEDGLWAASELASEAYWEASSAEARADLDAPARDGTRYTDANAIWIHALADAGAGLGREDWVRSAAGALETLVHGVVDETGAVHHAWPEGGEPELPGLLGDVAALGRACTAVAQATGETRWLTRAGELATRLKTEFLDDDGSFHDCAASIEQIGALRHRQHPPEDNAEVARLLLELFGVTGERALRAMAERLLGVLSPLAPRYGAAGAPLAHAALEFFEAPVQFFLVGTPEATAELRREAATAPLPARRIWTRPEGGRVGSLEFPAEPAPAIYVCGASSRSAPVAAPGDVAAAVASVS